MIGPRRRLLRMSSMDKLFLWELTAAGALAACEMAEITCDSGLCDQIRSGWAPRVCIRRGCANPALDSLCSTKKASFPFEIAPEFAVGAGIGCYPGVSRMASTVIFGPTMAMRLMRPAAERARIIDRFQDQQCLDRRQISMHCLGIYQ